MSLPFGNTDTACAHFVQELPQDYGEPAIEFKAFSRARKIKSPAQLLQVVLCYGGIDQVLREVAGNITLLAERISDTAIHPRLKACLPWVKALLERMIGAAAGSLIHGPLRFVVIEGSTVQGPGGERDLVSAAHRGGFGQVAPDSGRGDRQAPGRAVGARCKRATWSWWITATTKRRG